MKAYLQVKLINLADEAKLIRSKEWRRLALAKKSLENNHPETAEYHMKIHAGHHSHRVTVVRDEARLTNLAYGFLRGNEYCEMEERAKEEPDWNRIRRMALRFREKEYDELVSEFDEWLKRAKEDWFAGNLELKQDRLDRAANRRMRKELRKVNETLLDAAQ